MKSLFRKLFILAALMAAILVSGTAAYAGDEPELPEGATVEDLGGKNYQVTISGVETVVADFVDSIKDYLEEKSGTDEFKFKVILGEGVDAIDERAFFYCDCLTSVEITGSIKTIGESAFGSCSSLTTINIPDSVESIGGSAFQNCSSLTTIKIPDTVTSVGSGVFEDCTGITDAEIGNGVKDIRNMFYGCGNLKEVSIGSSVENMNFTFYGCKALETVELPESVSSIRYAFDNCQNLQSVVMPETTETLTKIEDGAFSGCKKLETIIIPEGVQEIGEGAFRNCESLASVTIPTSIKKIFHAFTKYGDDPSALEEIHYNGTWKQWKDIQIANGYDDDLLTYKDGLIGTYKKVKYVENKESNVTIICRIEDSRFDKDGNKIGQVLVSYEGTDDNVYVEGVSIDPDSASLDIGEKIKLNAIIAPESAENRDVVWISSDDNIAYVNTSGTVTGCGEGTANITVISLDGGFEAVCTVTVSNKEYVAELPEGVQIKKIRNESGHGYVKVVINGVDEITDVLTADIKNYLKKKYVEEDAEIEYAYIEEIEIGNNVKAIGDRAFQGFSYLKKASLGNSIQRIGDRAFENCEELVEVNIPETVAEIGEYAFCNCTYLEKDIIIPASVTAIGKGTFKYCQSLKSITLPAELEEIGRNAFSDCNSLEDIYYYGSWEQWKDLNVVYYEDDDCPLIYEDEEFDYEDKNYYALIGTYATVENGVVTRNKIDDSRYDRNGDEISSVLVHYDYSGVTTVAVESVALDKVSANLEKGKAVTLTATVLPEDAANKNVSWKSSNTKAATIVQNGNKCVVTGIAAGTADITVTTEDGNKTATCKVKVTDPVVPVTGVKLNATSAGIAVGKTLTLTPTVAPSNATNKAVTWKSSNTKIATVTSAGIVKGIAAGTANITVTTTDGKKTAVCKVTVTIPVSSVKLNKTSASILRGTTFTLTPTVAPSNATNKAVTWKSSNTKIATVTSAGVVKGIAKGTANITVTTVDGKKTAVCKVTVTNPVAVKSVKLSKTSASVVKGYTITLKPTINPSNATNKKVTWKSSNTKIAIVTSAGVVKGVRAGTANITVITADGKKTAVCKVTVTNPVAVKSVKLSKTSASVVKGYTITLKPTINPSNATNKKVTWKSSNTKIATVTSAGVVKGVRAGTANITVITADGKKTAVCKVKVTNPVAVKSIKLNKTSVSIAKGKTYTLQATITPSNATNKTVTWKSSNTKIATVSSKGVVKGVKAGTVTITAVTKDGSKKASCKVTVR